MSDEAKALGEISKATGKAIDATSDLGKFIGRYVGGPIETAMGILHDRLSYVRWERRQRLIRRAEEFSVESGLVGRIEPMPLSVAVPLITAAVLEEDDYLQDEWAKLLVNAADAGSKGTPFKTFVKILEDMTADDAKMLRSIAEVPPEYLSDNGYLATQLLPHGYRMLENKASGEVTAPSEGAAIILFNLLRLGLIEKGGWAGHSFNIATITPLGRAFIKACSLSTRPKSRSAS